MRVAVVDTSALLRLFVPDGPIPDGLEDFLDDAWRAEATLMTPELALAEVGQALMRKERLIGRSRVDAILDAVLELPVEVVGHGELIADALDAARRLEITVYDALFVALATRRRCDLFTADRTLEKALVRARC